MKVLFYSNKCPHCKKLLLFLEQNNINIFKKVNIETEKIPNIIKKVPSIIDPELNQPLEGNKVLEYVINMKYFNNQTNNIECIKEPLPNPNIPIYEKSYSNKINNLNLKNKNSTSIDNTSLLNDLFVDLTENIIKTNKETNISDIQDIKSNTQDININNKNTNVKSKVTILRKFRK
jgi:arsenate reductase-like glutaredoxin family protein